MPLRRLLTLLLLATCLPATALADDGWQTEFAPALEKAQQSQQPMVVDMWASWCGPCLKFAKTTLVDDGVKARLKGFVTVKLDMDAPANADLWKRYNVDNLPRVLFLDTKGEAVTALTLKAFEDAAAFSARLDKARAHFELPAVEGAVAGHEAGEGAGAAFDDVPETAVEEKPAVVARLITDVDAATPGQTIKAGVHLQVEDGWHVYWRYPGDAGRATQVNWVLPEGATSGALQWPAPLKFSEQDGALTTYGYAEEQLLTSTINLPEAVKVGSTVPVEAKVEWLVCREKCIPGRATLSRTLNIAAAAAPSKAAATLASPKALQVVTEHPHWAAEITYEGTPLKPEKIARGHITLTYSGPDAPLSLASGDHVVPFVPDSGKHFTFSDVAWDVQGKKIRVDFTVQAGELAPDSGATDIGGVIRVKAGDDEVALRVAAPVSHDAEIAANTGPGPAPIPAADLPKAENSAPAGTPLWEMLLYAFIGGMLLNIMPCVLPVLSIKVLGLVHQAGESKTRVLQHGLVYALGVLVSFWVLAGVVIGLKTSGELVGWGFQFQNPWFVVSLTALVFGFGLSMFGVFEVSLPGMQVAAGASGKSGLSGSFSNGAFATLLATPCTAPFLGPALGYAFTQPSGIIVLFFTTVGLGLAFPFVVLARFPAWTRKIPKPGPWMETFKQVMGFLLMGTVIWLVDVMSQQLTRASLIRVLVFLGIVAVASWVYGRFGNFASSARRRWIATLAALFMIVGGGKVALVLNPASAQLAPAEEGSIAWQAFSPDAVAAHQKAGKTVFIDFTAAWCVTCKVNENTVIETDEIKALLGELDVVTMKADYTNEDPVIAEWLRRFNRVGVPLYVVIPGAKPDDTIVLPEILTHDMLVEALRKAGPSRG
ncbi:MAG: thioredoxin family protein [Bradymonadia bacterium]